MLIICQKNEDSLSSLLSAAAESIKIYHTSHFLQNEPSRHQSEHVHCNETRPEAHPPPLLASDNADNFPKQTMKHKPDTNI